MTINGISYEDAHPEVDPEEQPKFTECADEQMGAVDHCGNDCGGWQDEAGQWQPSEECEHCGCCTCNSCEYARVA